MWAFFFFESFFQQLGIVPEAFVKWMKENEDGEFEEALELEEVVSIAAEKAPINDAAVLAIRAAYKQVKDEFASALAPEKAEVRRLGGLYVVGTERHESRRIDRQLRGRCSRQGDPGRSKFFISLEDDLMRLFANSGPMAKILQNSMEEGCARVPRNPQLVLIDLRLL